MKSIFKIAACLSFASLLVYSCKLEEIDTQMTEEEAIAAIKLDCDALESYTIQALKPQAVSFTVTSTTPWTVSTDADWLTVTPASSAESSLSEDVRITAVANPEIVDRSATVTVKGENTSKSYSFTITQLRKGQLTVTPVDHDFATAGEAQQFTVESNQSWTASSDQEWLTLSVMEGTTDGALKATVVTATAEKNESVVRTATVTVISGDEKVERTVRQKGQTLEFLEVADPTVASEGGDILLGVNSTMEWKAETSDPDFTATKVSDTQLKVTAKWNKRFVDRTATVTITPVDAKYGDASASVTLTQGTNFEFAGNCVLDNEGFVTVTEGELSRIILKNGMRYGKLILEIEDAGFEDGGQMWYVNKVAPAGETPAWGAQLYNWLTIGKTRLRAEGTLEDGMGMRIGSDSYMSTSYDIDADELSGMSSYEMDIYPDATDPTHLHMDFIFDGEIRCQAECRNPFYGNDLVGETYVGVFTSGSTSDTYFVVKSCELIVIND